MASIIFTAQQLAERPDFTPWLMAKVETFYHDMQHTLEVHMSQTFRVGDRVRLVKDYSRYALKGATAVVTQAFDGQYLYITWEQPTKQMGGGYSLHYFELASPSYTGLTPERLAQLQAEVKAQTHRLKVGTFWRTPSNTGVRVVTKVNDRSEVDSVNCYSGGISYDGWHDGLGDYEVVTPAWTPVVPTVTPPCRPLTLAEVNDLRAQVIRQEADSKITGPVDTFWKGSSTGTIYLVTAPNTTVVVERHGSSPVGTVDTANTTCASQVTPSWSVVPPPEVRFEGQVVNAAWLAGAEVYTAKLAQQQAAAAAEAKRLAAVPRFKVGDVLSYHYHGFTSKETLVWLVTKVHTDGSRPLYDVEGLGQGGTCLRQSMDGTIKVQPSAGWEACS